MFCTKGKYGGQGKSVGSVGLDVNADSVASLLYDRRRVTYLPTPQRGPLRDEGHNSICTTGF